MTTKQLENIYYNYKILQKAYQATRFLRKSALGKLLLSPFKPNQTIVDNLVNLIENDPILSITEFGGSFYLDPRSHIFRRIVTSNCYEPDLTGFCRKYLNSSRDIVDVGANIGLFSVMFAKSIDDSRKVLSIEPTQNALKRLMKNIELNDVKEKIILFDGVASNRLEQIEIKTIVGKEEYSTIGSWSHPSIDEESYTLEKVKSSTIDELVKINDITPGFIKVDVEGCEHLVFDGARQTLEHHRPIIISELCDFLLSKNGSSARQVVKTISSYEYDIFDPTHLPLKPGEREFGNIICFPKEMGITYSNLLN